MQVTEFSMENPQRRADIGRGVVTVYYDPATSAPFIVHSLPDAGGSGRYLRYHADPSEGLSGVDMVDLYHKVMREGSLPTIVS